MLENPIPMNQSPFWVDWFGSYSDSVLIQEIVNRRCFSTSQITYDITFSVICPYHECVDDWYDATEFVRYRCLFDKEKGVFTSVRRHPQRNGTRRYCLGRKGYPEGVIDVEYIPPKEKIPKRILNEIAFWLMDKKIVRSTRDGRLSETYIILPTWPYEDLGERLFRVRRDENLNMILEGT